MGHWVGDPECPNAKKGGKGKSSGKPGGKKKGFKKGSQSLYVQGDGSPTSHASETFFVLHGAIESADEADAQWTARKNLSSDNALFATDTKDITFQNLNETQNAKDLDTFEVLINDDLPDM